MRYRIFTSLSALAIATAAGPIVSVSAAGQAPPTATGKTTVAARAYRPPRTSDGQPDVQGVWDFRGLITQPFDESAGESLDTKAASRGQRRTAITKASAVEITVRADEIEEPGALF